MSFSKEKHIKSATYAAVLTASTLVISKFIVWRLTDSMSLQASLMDSLLDVLASIVNFVVVRQALKPADENHRFGHGKAEALAGLAQSMFITGSAFWLLIEVINRLTVPHAMVFNPFGNWVMIGATFLTLMLVLYQRYVIKKTNSLVIKADCLHYKTDILTNLGVLLSLNLSTRFQIARLDAFIGGAIALYILWTSYEIIKSSLSVLMDEELPDAPRNEIEAIVSSHEGVMGFHDLRTRSAGQYLFIQLHLDIDATLTLKRAHKIAQEVEDSLKEHFPEAQVIIHQDPYPHEL
ncbi:MAG TPA: cation diffusion facilitator family transporter [Alphaproteobacteria bacterium]|nr:cation diffusion facilitator family transporter [Alphaproteobacteria bacterium]